MIPITTTDDDNSKSKAELSTFSGGNPTKQLAFEINPPTENWRFVPNYYPAKLTQKSSNELQRNGGKCANEDIRVKKNKNREIHIEGIILEERLPQIHVLMDFTEKVDLISPLAPNQAGLECNIKSCEQDERKGWNEKYQQYMFGYTIDLVSTGQDGFDESNNAIVSAVLDEESDNVNAIARLTGQDEEDIEDAFDSIL